MTKNVVGGQRRTSHINRRVTQSVLRAFDYAKDTGRPFNRYVVINLRDTPAESPTDLFRRIVHKYRDWLVNKIKKGVLPKERPIYVYSLENPNGMPHANWVIYVPPALLAEFEKKLPAWVKKAKGDVGDFDIDCQPIDQARYKRLAKYVVKGTDPAFVEHFYLGEVHAPQGQVWGRRAGASIAIGQTVRREANYRPSRRRKDFYQRPTGNRPVTADQKAATGRG